MNDYIAAERTHRQKGAAMKKQWQDACQMSLRSQLHGRKLHEPAVLRYVWHEANRKRDKDNICGFARKVLQDALVQIGALRNDGWASIERWDDRFVDDGWYGVEIFATCDEAGKCVMAGRQRRGV